MENKQEAHKEKLNRLVCLNIEIANSSARRAYLIKNKVPLSDADEM
jgi:hypothetical protein